jgi:hypothetical protein
MSLKWVSFHVTSASATTVSRDIVSERIKIYDVRAAVSYKASFYYARTLISMLF